MPKSNLGHFHWNGFEFCKDFSEFLKSSEIQVVKIVVHPFDNFSYLKFIIGLYKACQLSKLPIEIYLINFNEANKYSMVIDKIFFKQLILKFCFFLFRGKQNKSIVSIFSVNRTFVEIPSYNYSSWRSLRDDRESLELSVKSGIATNYSVSILDEDFLHNWSFIAPQINSYWANYHTAQEILKNSSDSLTIFFNGRFSSQAAWRQICDELGVHFLSLEHGSPKNKNFHLQAFQPQEIQDLNKALNLQKLRTEISEEQVSEFARKWIFAQGHDYQKNPFLPRNPHYISKFDMGLPSGNKLLAFFTSSLDERLSNLSENTSDWESQEKAISLLSQKSHQEGYNLIVRIHPNSMNKNAKSLINLVKSMQAEEIRYILPWESVSAQDLIHKSDLVGSWGSTATLESAYCGRPSFTLTQTKYSSLSGIKILSSKDLFATNLSSITPISKSRAEEAIFHTQNYGCEIDVVFSTLEKRWLN